MAFKKEAKKFGKRPSRDARPSYSERPSRPFERKGGRSNSIELFDAVCERCGKDCQLPFRPSGGKPVYCRNCFNNDAPKDTRGPRTAPSGDLQEINRKLDRIMRALKIE